MARHNKLFIDRLTAIHMNSGYAVTSSGWVRTANGVWFLDRNLTSKIMIIDVPLNKGDIIYGFRILGGMGAAATGSSTLDADLRYVYNASGSITSASLGTITQVHKIADYKVDESKTLTTPHTVINDYHYYIKITGTTRNLGASDIFISGVEVDVKKKYGLSQTA
jgi:hypothetical protein